MRKKLSFALVLILLLVHLPLTVSAANTEDVITEDRLIAHYDFTERPSDGITLENKATGENAVGNAAVENSSTATWSDNSLIFNGAGYSNSPTGTWVSLPNDILAGKESATIVMEVKPDASMLNSFHFLWSIGNSGTNTYWFTNLRDPRTTIKYGGSEKIAAGSSKLTADRWYSISGVIDAATKTMSFYIDGVKVSEIKDANMSLLQVSDQSRNTIGRAPYNDPLYKGAVSTFRLYDRALSSDEIKTIADTDAQLHADTFEPAVDEILNNVADVKITDSVQLLPDYDGFVTWESNDDSIVIREDGQTANVVQPAAGEEAITTKITATATVRGTTKSKEINVTIMPEPDADDPYGYLLVHFLEDSAGYKEKIYLDISRGDNPEEWDPLNNGEAILTSSMGTTGSRDPFLTYNPETKTYYIISTDLRVFGGDAKIGNSWGQWQKNYSTKMNVWESKDLVNWSEQRQFDVALNGEGVKQANLGMMWAPEALWVPDYYGEGDGAFVVYWSSRYYNDEAQTIDTGSRVMWGATRDFTQDTYEYGGIFVNTGADTIDTTMIQNDGKTYRITKQQQEAVGIFMEVTESKTWWLPDTQWTTIQRQLGKEWAGSASGVEGPAVFKNHSEDNKWYLYVDVIPTIGYRPMVSTNLDQGFTKYESSSFYMAPHTKHGGVISLTKAQYDTIRAADVASINEDANYVTVDKGISVDDLRELIPEANVNLTYNRGASTLPVDWDLSSANLNEVGIYTVKGTVKSIGANLNEWYGTYNGDDNSDDYRAENKTTFSTTALTVFATIEVTDPDMPTPVYLIGDVSLDNKVNLKDVLIIQKHVADIKSFSDDEVKMFVADVNKDGDVTLADALLIQRWITKLYTDDYINTLQPMN